MNGCVANNPLLSGRLSALLTASSKLLRGFALSSLLLAGGCSLGFRSANRGTDGVECKNTNQLIKHYRAEEPKASLYIPAQKVRRLPEPALEITPEVKHHMRVFGGSKTRFIESAVDQRDKDYPLLAQIFRDEGVPETMLNLALIESGFRNEAQSPVGAVGMWQFMKSTARLYGLKVGLFVDERKDPILSTIAAARHLRDLYDQYGDWNLALAAYNAGTGAVDRVLTRSGNRNFWVLARSGKFSRQTAEFVPKFIAASLLVNSVMAERNPQDSNRQFAALGIASR